MFPRYPNSPPPPPQRHFARPAPASRIEFLEAPIPDPESRLSAELDGASWAVVAFAPGDEAWAEWLYRNLNGYTVPAQLVEKPTTHGLPRPDCVSIFPDLRDPDYGNHFPRALEKSGYLVVICSPRSAHCAAVDAQICAFKSAGGDERIIALVVDGKPGGGPEIVAKSADHGWLPAWLRWRFSDDAFCEADPGEPRIVDARSGRVSLREARDLLLANLLDMDAWELEIMGGLARPVEVVSAATDPASTTTKRKSVSAMTAPHTAVRPGLLAGAICIGITAISAWWSMDRLERDRNLVFAAPVRVVVAHKRANHPPQPPAQEPATEEFSQTGEAARTAGPPVPAAAGTAAEIEASRNAQPEKQIPGPVTSIIRGGAPVAPSAPAEETGNREVVVALHRRGDDAVNLHRLDAALSFYEEAADTARESAQHASADSRADYALLCRKLGTLQLQMASTAEARASFIQGRKLLLQLKKQGQWNHERAKVLAEIETGLKRLPRD